MAIAYATGTINEATAGAVGTTMAETIRDNLIAHAAWELEEEFTPGDVCWYVFRCTTPANGFGDDFYLVLSRTLATGLLCALVCEGYDNITNTVTKFAPISGTGTTDADGCYNGSYVLGSTALPASSLTPGFVFWTPSGTSTKWWTIVDDDRLTVAFNGAANGFINLGGFTWLGDTINDLPLQISGTSGTGGWITRNPDIPSTGGINFSKAVNIYAGGDNGPLATNTTRLVPLGFQGPWATNDAHLTDRRSVAEVGMVHTFTDADIATLGYVVGKQKGMRFSGHAAPGGFAFGDAYVLNGTLWVPYLPTDGRIWDTGVAA